jgi:predicted nucleotidyltransferase
MDQWIPVDGDTFTTHEGLIFNVFGYEHPEDRVLAFLKYIPASLKELFSLKYLEQTWNFAGREMFRAENLYSAKNYQVFLESFRKSFPDYLYYCPYRKKEVISAPLHDIERIFTPKDCFKNVDDLETKDELQETALEFIDLLSRASEISRSEFGIHGSIGLNMHTSKSDIDLVVYGGKNFRTLEKTITKLVEKGNLTYKIKNRLDAVRLYKLTYKNKIVMYNAVRKPEEIKMFYGNLQYTPLGHVQFACRVLEDREAIFRPATYCVEQIETKCDTSLLQKEVNPKTVVSMIGCYRNVARDGDKIEVSGTLERVEDLEKDSVSYQVVVGTGMNEDEHIWPA